MKRGHAIKPHRIKSTLVLFSTLLVNHAYANVENSADGEVVALGPALSEVPIPIASESETLKPVHAFTFRVAALTDNRVGGLSISNFNPVVQGGIDYTHTPTGIYAGASASMIKWIANIGGDNNGEWHLNVGKRGDITTDIAYDVGAERYYYPSSHLSRNPDTTYVYGQLSYKLINLKYSRTLTNLFGNPNSLNSESFDLYSNIPIQYGMTLGLHLGHQNAKNNHRATYSDWKIGVAKEIVGITWTLAAVGTNADRHFFVTPDGRFTGRTGVVLAAEKFF